MYGFRISPFMKTGWMFMSPAFCLVSPWRHTMFAPRDNNNDVIYSSCRVFLSWVRSRIRSWRTDVQPRPRITSTRIGRSVLVGEWQPLRQAQSRLQPSTTTTRTAFVMAEWVYWNPINYVLNLYWNPVFFFVLAFRRSVQASGFEASPVATSRPARAHRKRTR